MQKLRKWFQHCPYGKEHPYQSGPDERFPRKPIEGQPVVLGVVSLENEIVRVWAEYSVNGSQERSAAEGSLVSDAEQGGNWQIELPSFLAGDTVEYTIYASDGKTQEQSDPFVFTCLGWQESTGPVSYTLHSNGIDLHFPDGEQAPQANLRILMNDPWGLDFSVFWGEAPVLPKTEAANYQILDKNQNGVVLTTASVRIEVSTSPYSLKVYNQKNSLIFEQDSPPSWLSAGDSLPLSLQLNFHSTPEEKFYGFGERYNGLNQRGNTLDIRVYEEYKNQGKRTYFPVPFFLSSRGYGFYIDSTREVSFDLCSREAALWSCEIALNGEPSCAFTLFTAQNPVENLRAFSALTGKPKLPPQWIFGLWMSSNEWNSQAEVMKQLTLMQEYDIPAEVLVIEAWSDESTFYIWNDAVYQAKSGLEHFKYQDFTFNEDGLWPDPKAMVDKIHQLGMKLILWQIPVMKTLEEPHPQHDADEQTMIEKGYCVMNPDGSPHRIHTPWFPGALLLDVTNPEAVAWWMEKRAYLLEDLQIDGFKTDGGEHLWPRDTKFANGLTGHELINDFPNLYVGSYHRFANEKRNGEAVTFSRAGFTGAQAFPCHWAGDENSNWGAFRSNLLAGLNVGLSGVPFWGWDIAGFSGPIPSAELYLRSTAMAAFCPIMQYHSEFNNHQVPNVDRTPWNIAERTNSPEVIDIFRKFVQIRKTLLPYIKQEAAYCAQSGEPLMRPLFLDWSQDAVVWEIEDQYCFGREYLVAPVLEEGAVERKLYLPAGNWEDFWTKEILQGEQWVTRAAALDEIPVYRLIP